MRRTSNNRLSSKARLYVANTFADNGIKSAADVQKRCGKWSVDLGFVCTVLLTVAFAMPAFETHAFAAEISGGTQVVERGRRR